MRRNVDLPQPEFAEDGDELAVGDLGVQPVQDLELVRSSS